MATVLRDALVTFGGTDISDEVKAVATFNYAAEALDNTLMGADTRTQQGGLFVWDVSVEFLYNPNITTGTDYLFALVGTTGALVIRANKTTSVGATNPNFEGTALLTSYPPLAGQVGELARASATFVAAGTLTREVT